MDAAGFWRLVTDTRDAAGNDTGRQSELLDPRLRGSPQSRCFRDHGWRRASAERGGALHAVAACVTM
jgi:hypothetical protein